jgi:hypothetical protein
MLRVILCPTAVALLVVACGESAGPTGVISRLPDCPSGPLLTVSPLADGDFVGLNPMGHLNPPAHTLPTDHIYFYLQPGANPGDPSRPAPVRAPGDVHVWSLTGSTYFDPSGTELYTDYGIWLAACRQVTAYFQHVQQLAPYLAAATSSWGSCRTYAGGSIRLCMKNIDVIVSAGDTLGIAGGRLGQGALDFGAHDARIAPLGFANQRRYETRDDGEDGLHVLCPADLFDPATRAALEARFGESDGSPLRTIEPRCGSVVQDVAGTAQGNWYKDAPSATHDWSDPATSTWSQQLALVHDNVDPTGAVISIGGTIGPAAHWPGFPFFTPTHSGTVNREFSEVTADGNVYCYSGPGRILIRLLNDSTLSVEQQAGDCSSPVAFVTSTTYAR